VITAFPTALLMLRLPFIFVFFWNQLDLLVSQSARRSVPAALSAKACDEIFAGYNRYDYLMKHGKKLRAMPGITDLHLKI